MQADCRDVCMTFVLKALVNLRRKEDNYNV